MLDENISTLSVATDDTQHAVALILDAAVTAFEPTDRAALHGVAVALGAVLSFEGPSAEHVISRAFMRAGMFDAETLDHAIDHAAMAFWTQFAACYPEIGTGDLDAQTDATLLGAMHAAGREWLQVNA